jgi:hypothetical protein
MGMYLDGILTAPHIDTSGEILEIDGVDLTDFYEGKAVINFEHQNKLAEDIIGSFIYCKKILDKKDCENERQKMFFEMAKGPYVYVVGELFDDQGHPGAIAAAAMVRYFSKRKEKMFIGWSIEGSTLERDGNSLKRAVARRAAFTLRPCLRSAAMGVPEEGEIEKFLKKMNKSESELYEIDSDALILSESDIPILNPFLELNKALQDLNKTLTAGTGNIAPSQLIGGAALTKEHITGTVKNKILAALRDREKGEPIKRAIKAALPEVSDEYIDYFSDLAEDLALKKGLKPLDRIGKEHLLLANDDDQNILVDGIYYPKEEKYDPNQNYRVDSNNIVHSKNDFGQEVTLKMPESAAADPVTFYNAGKHFFDLKDHIPVTALIAHHKLNNGKPIQVTEFLKGKTPYESKKAWEDAISLAKIDGTAQKLFILDHVLGNNNRNKGNIIIGEDGKLKLIDNEEALKYGEKISDLSEFNKILHEDTPHKHVLEWLELKDPKKLAKLLYNNNCNPEVIKNAVERLIALKRLLNEKEKIGDSLKRIQRPNGGEIENG